MAGAGRALGVNKNHPHDAMTRIRDDAWGARKNFDDANHCHCDDAENATKQKERKRERKGTYLWRGADDDGYILQTVHTVS
jgi:hypothetical protein